MNLHNQTSNTVPNLMVWLPLIITLLLFTYPSRAQAATQNTSVGVIIDVNSETGNQQRRAMEIAAQTFNNRSRTHNIILFFRDSDRNPLQAASAGDYYLMNNI